MFSPPEGRHIDKTYQDRQPVNGRQRVQEWLDRQSVGTTRADALRRMLVQVPRIARGSFDLRHLNAYVKYRKVVNA